MKTRSSRRPLAAVALATAVILAAGSLARAEAAPAGSGRHGRQPAAAAAPTALSAIQHWVNRLLAAAGLAPAPTLPAGSSQSAPPPTQDDNGAGIDPNG